jgi:hypothetical protein
MYIWNQSEERCIFKKQSQNLLLTTFENGKLEIINGLIKGVKLKSTYYPKRAELTKADLEKKVTYVFRNYEDQKLLLKNCFQFYESVKKMVHHN